MTEHTHSLDVRIDCQFLADQGFLTSALLTLSSVQFSSVAQSCPTLSYPMDCSLPGSSVHGILQARVLEQVAISYSRGSLPPRD